MEENKKENLIEKEQYDIFTIVTDKNIEEKENVLLTLGNFCLAKFEKVEECKKYVNSKPYELIVTLTAITSQQIYKMEKEHENEQQKCMEHDLGSH